MTEQNSGTADSSHYGPVDPGSAPVLMGRGGDLNSARLRVTAAVMTHPKRLPGARQVLARLAPLEARLAVDPQPDGPPTSMRSAQIAFAVGEAGVTHHLVVQDDVWLPEGFADAACQAMSLHPDRPISFFVEWGSPTATLARWAALTGVNWVPVINPYVPTLALALPRRLSTELARYLQDEATAEMADDIAVRRFLRRAGKSALVAVPNLVEHLEFPSLTGNDGHGVRRSACVLPEVVPTFDNRVLLEVPRLVPFVAWTHGVSTVIDTADETLATRRPTADVLTTWGTSRSELFAAYESALQGRTASLRQRATVCHTYLFEVWLTAAAMGAIQQTQWPASIANLSSRLDDPAAVQALRTMAPGALRLFVDPDTLLSDADELTALWLDAMEYGAAHCNADLDSAFHGLSPVGS